jgi:hypothetical protein
MRAATEGPALLVKQAVEAMWEAYRGRATTHWLREFPCQTHNRFWEMYLTLVLQADGHRLEPLRSVRRDEGPDVVILRDGAPPVVLEAVCATLGEPDNPNSVPPFPNSTPGNTKMREYPDEQVVLRMTTALHTKAKQRDSHIAAGLVDPASPFVIALNNGGAFELKFGPLEPMALKALFPIGSPYGTYDVRIRATIERGWTTREAITKVPSEPGAGEAPVPLTMFTDSRFAGVSAVLCSSADLANHSWIELQPGSPGFVLVRNPYATNPLPPDFLPVDEVIDAVPVGPDRLELRRAPGRAPALCLPTAALV